jgi:hypothetical protein
VIAPQRTTGRSSGRSARIAASPRVEVLADEPRRRERQPLVERDVGEAAAAEELEEAQRA